MDIKEAMEISKVLKNKTKVDLPENYKNLFRRVTVCSITGDLVYQFKQLEINQNLFGESEYEYLDLEESTVHHDLGTSFIFKTDAETLSEYLFYHSLLMERLNYFKFEEPLIISAYQH